jgi:UDPglucose 6-dehydrogenase
MKIRIVGTGSVGLSLAVLLSQKHDVKALDILEDRVVLIYKKQSPII